MFGTIIGDVDGLTLGIDIGTEMGYFDGFFDSSNHSKIEVLLLVGSLGYNDGKVLGSHEGIKLGSTDGNMLGTILGHVDGIILELGVVTDLGSLYGYFDGYNYGKLESLLNINSLICPDGKVIGSD